MLREGQDRTHGSAPSDASNVNGRVLPSQPSILYVEGRRRIETLSIIFLVLIFLAPSALAHTQWPAERRMSSLIRAARVVQGLPDLHHGTRLHRFARQQVERMIACRCVKHAQPPLFCERWGQVVGIGKSTRAIFRAFMTSPAHRRILLSPAFRRLGVGARWSGGLLYLAVELCA